VKTELPQHISDFADTAARRLFRIGGPPAALLAETDDGPRLQAAAALRELGADDLDVRADIDNLLAAAVLSQAAGAVVLPYPVVEELLSIDGARLTIVNPAAPRIDHGDLSGEWVVADIDGHRYDAEISERTNAKLGPFLVPATLRPAAGTVSPSDIDLYLVLGSWRILGALQRCLDIVREHVKARVQFRKALAEFQAVRFAIADADVALRGLAELAKYTLTRSATVPPAARSSDALMLRLKAVDTAQQVLRTSHQLLGALGFCDESDVSVIDRHIQPLLRLPLSGEELALRLLPDIRDGHLETLFSEPG
jgi:hypothetical protein